MDPTEPLRPVEEIAAIFQSLRTLGIQARDTFSEVLRQTLKANPGLVATWTIWEPNAFDGVDRLFRDAPGHDSTGRFVPSWQRRDGDHLDVSPATGYERPGPGDFYLIPQRERQLCALGPYRYSIGGKLQWITSEVAPISEHGRCVGVVGLDAVATRTDLDKHQLHPRSESTSFNVRILRRAPSHSALRSLTSREREVHFWLGRGKSNDEIGIILGISTHTVKNHLERVFRKLGVENRYAAALTR